MGTDVARVYDNSTREERARETRRRIVATAEEMVLAGGYAAMTVADLAARAGVSPQTVYNSVGGKAEVVKAAYDLLLVGDDEPVVMVERPAYLALVDAPDPDAFVRAYAALSRGVYQRVGRFLGVLLEHGPGGDAGLEEFVATIDRERRVGATGAVTLFRDRFGLARGATLPRVVDVVWTLNAPELHRRLVLACGWSDLAYERWLAEHLALVLRPPG